MQLTRGHRTQAHLAMRLAVVLALGGLFLGGLTGAGAPQPDRLSFDMVVSAGAKNCLPNARAHVAVNNVGANQRMHVVVNGLPPHTTFTLFVLQVPTAPFAMSWYQGDIDTGKHGSGSQQFFGIFSSETFVFAPANRDAPQTHPGVDALTNPPTEPVHMYHLGLWFSDAADAAAAGCPNTVTPFDGDHQAGIQVLNTSNFGTEAQDGPLGQLE
jgi:hypothetical protein